MFIELSAEFNLNPIKFIALALFLWEYPLEIELELLTDLKVIFD